MVIPAIFYIIWDICFTTRGIWSFNPDYITGYKIANLPIEEVLFFFIVPYCCVFIYECIRVYFPSINKKKLADHILKLLAATLLIAGILFYKKDYTAYTFILFAFFVSLFYGFKKYFPTLKTSTFLVSYVVILLPFLLVNGFLTAIPVVLYNDAENLGVRIYTIPFEDVFYGMLLVFMNVVIYEKLRTLF